MLAFYWKAEGEHIPVLRAPYPSATIHHNSNLILHYIYLQVFLCNDYISHFPLNINEMHLNDDVRSYRFFKILMYFFCVNWYYVSLFT